MSRRDPSEDWHESCVFAMQETQINHATPEHPVEHRLARLLHFTRFSFFEPLW
jgi:hypothetical protein